MTCAEVQSLLGKHARGTLCDERGGVEAHLAGCAVCGALARTLSLLAAEETGAPDPSYFTHLLPRIHERIDARRARRIPAWLLRFALPASSAAAAVLVAVRLASVSPALPEAALGGASPAELSDYVEEQSLVGAPRTLGAERSGQEDAGLLDEILGSAAPPLSEPVEESIYGTAGDGSGGYLAQAVSAADAEEIVPVLERQHH